MADESHATEQVAQSFNVVEVPTFIFMRNGREVARHVGSSRGDLIGKILQVHHCRNCQHS
jgi:thioredoxin-like negative regulator of GroEL